MMARGPMLLVLGILCFGYGVSANGWGDSHEDDSDYNRRHYSSCPAQDPITHECFDLRAENTTCVVFHLVCQYMSDGTCRLRYKMVSVPCQMYKCKSLGCCPGYIRNEFGRCKDKSSSESGISCENGGWTKKTKPDVCECLPNYTGDRCEKAYCPKSCLNGGRCEIMGQEAVCICPSDFYSGPRCETVECTGKCQNGGQCIQDGVQARCKCPDGYIGELCQYEINDECPRVSDDTECTDVARQQCNQDGDCQGDSICCYDGCSTVCTEPVHAKCEWGGNSYFPGDSRESDACSKCVCQATGEFHCVNITCPRKSCPDGNNPIRVEGHCCKMCPGDESPDVRGPVFTNCPTRPVFASVPKDGFIAQLPVLSELKAVDYADRQLTVHYSHDDFAHSRSAEADSNLHYVTAYSECDMYGRRAECVFQVLVVDRYPPKFTSCPIEIYAVDDETITWDDPVASDNVGIYRMVATGDKVRGKMLEEGTYVVSYTVQDYDQNKAICSFIIRIFDRDGFHTGFRPSYSVGLPVETIVGCSVAAVIVTGLLVFIFKRLRKQEIDSASASHTEQAMDNIFMMSGNTNTNDHNYENDVKLPAYSPPTNPPPYEEIGPPPTTDLGNINTTDLGNINTTDLGNANNEEPPVYEEIPVRNQEPHYENTTNGHENPAYVNENINDDKNMEYLKT